MSRFPARLGAADLLQDTSAGDPSRVERVMLPHPARDPRSDTTALVVAAAGVIGPVPYLMAGAALRMAGSPRRSWKAATATALAVATILLHTVLLVWLVASILS